MDFQAWPKIARLNRDIVVTEKIDGTNAAVLIDHLGTHDEFGYDTPRGALGVWTVDGQDYAVGAQSRTRLLQLGQDNFGFALWVSTHAEDLISLLGAGRHFGEWWGSGIQRGYGQKKGVKNFSLFNTDRYADVNYQFEDDSTVGPVPVIYQGPFSQLAIENSLQNLRVLGSYAVKGFMKPEGLIVFHSAAQTMFKVTVEGDEKPKGQG